MSSAPQTLNDTRKLVAALESLAGRPECGKLVATRATSPYYMALTFDGLDDPGFEVGFSVLDNEILRPFWQSYGEYHFTGAPEDYLIQDAILGLMSLPDECLDLICTDPAYDTLEKWREMGTTTRLTNSTQSSNQWFGVVPVEYFLPFYRECWRVLKPGRLLYTMCNPDMAYELQPMLRQNAMGVKRKHEQFLDYRHTLIWEKVGAMKPSVCKKHGKKLVCSVPGCTEEHIVRGDGAPGMGYPYRRCYESILLHQKGKMKPMGARNIRDVLRIERLKGKDYYPTQKPTPLIEVFIRQSTLPGWIVCDPFAGSGSTLAVAHRLGRKFLGTDVSPDAKQFFQMHFDAGEVAVLEEDFRRSVETEGDHDRVTTLSLFSED